MLIKNYYSRLITILPISVAVLFLSACSLNTMPTEAVEEYEFVAVGYATMDAQKGATDDIKMLNAIKASKLEAYKELAEQVYGVMLTSENSVKEYQLQSNGIKGKVKGLVRGAKVLRTYHEDDLYITELGLNMKTLPFLKDAEFADNEAVIKVQSQVYY
ncbi:MULTISPECIES: LPP20 family lipoprotein [Psychromonas]|uniref:LPP20 family lipoprotein n=1 Tax=Psychromonas TaxID=67572 RepID=UPI00042823E7|nr:MULTISPECIES: LPP20 family lipoprotein [Psychromonas]MBB1274306.1 LPP20 family lipoprotein [Psychromonas sp. SR45-3]